MQSKVRLKARQEFNPAGGRMAIVRSPGSSWWYCQAITPGPGLLSLDFQWLSRQLCRTVLLHVCRIVCRFSSLPFRSAYHGENVWDPRRTFRLYHQHRGNFPEWGFALTRSRRTFLECSGTWRQELRSRTPFWTGEIPYIIQLWHGSQESLPLLGCQLQWRPADTHENAAIGNGNLAAEQSW